MRAVLSSTAKELRRIRRDPTMVLIWIGFPVLIVVVLLTLFGGEETRPHGLLLVSDEDDTILSSMVSSAYSQGELGEMITVDRVPREEGLERINSGDGSALLIIPDGFTDAFFNGEPSKLTLMVNPSQTIMPGMIEEVTSVMMEGAYYLNRVFGSEMRRYADMIEQPPDDMIASTSVRINHIFQDLEKYVDPLVIELTSEAIQEDEEPGPSIATLFFPGMIFMTVLFLSFGLAIDLWKERESGTLRRLAVTPGSLSSFLIGKIIALSLIFITVSAGALTSGVLLMDVEAGNRVMAVLWITVCGIGIYLLVALIQIFATNRRAGNIIGNVFVLILGMLGGSFFPFEVMPSWLGSIGRWTPNGWAVFRLKEMLAGTAGAISIATWFAGVLVFISLVFLLTQHSLRKRFLL